MPSYLHISVTFLDPAFHGRGDGGEPEWPPSPLRLFQALVAAAAARWGERQRLDYAVLALRWLEAQPPPLIVAPAAKAGTPFRLAVPNNDMDVPAGFWAQRREPPENRTPQRLKSMKTVRPTRLPTDENLHAVHYLWELTDDQAAEFGQYRETLFAAARSVVALGWGIDLVTGNGRVIDQAEADRLPRERWRPTTEPGATGLRVPAVGTLEALVGRHAAFLGRLTDGGFAPVPPLSAFAVVGYRRATDPAGRPWAAFRIVSVDPDEPRNPAFDPPRRCRDVAAWVRNAVARVCDGWPFGPTDGFVHGHGPDGKQLTGASADRRFMYLPLPTINPALNRVESIRRVLIATPPGFEDHLDWVRRRLPGQELIDLKERPVGLLTEHTGNPWVLDQYTKPARVWSTVTPVVLPGYDDPDHLRRRLRAARDPAEQKQFLGELDARVEGFLRTALRHAGFADELGAVVEWRAGGFRPGVGLVREYARPERLDRFSAYHVRIRWRVPVCGPLALGAGRYRGLGLFAAEGGP